MKTEAKKIERDDIIRMAREAGIDFRFDDGSLERFFHAAYAAGAAAEREKEKERQRYDIHSCGPDCDRYICVAVRKARQEERNKLAAWMIERSYATGHGDTMEDLLKELAWQIEERNNT